MLKFNHSHNQPFEKATGAFLRRGLQSNLSDAKGMSTTTGGCKLGLSQKRDKANKMQTL